MINVHFVLLLPSLKCLKSSFKGNMILITRKALKEIWLQNWKPSMYHENYMFTIYMKAVAVTGFISWGQNFLFSYFPFSSFPLFLFLLNWKFRILWGMKMPPFSLLWSRLCMKEWIACTYSMQIWKHIECTCANVIVHCTNVHETMQILNKSCTN